MFNWLRKKNYSIYMLQEVHCLENTISVWSAEWGFKTLFFFFCAAAAEASAIGGGSGEEECMYLSANRFLAK